MEVVVAKSYPGSRSSHGMGEDHRMVLRTMEDHRAAVQTLLDLAADLAEGHSGLNQSFVKIAYFVGNVRVEDLGVAHTCYPQSCQSLMHGRPWKI